MRSKMFSMVVMMSVMVVRGLMTNLRDSVLKREARKATRIDPAEALRAE